jgi:transcriptional antiterminator Rof (Rho-off)
VTSDYRPIGCDAHSGLEVLALRRMIAVLDIAEVGGQPRRVTGRVVDLLTRAGGEYLRIRSADGQGHDIRLDLLRTISTPSGAVLWRQESGT